MTESEIRDRVEFAQDLMERTWNPSIDWRIRQTWLSTAANICRELAVVVEGADKGDQDD